MPDEPQLVGGKSPDIVTTHGVLLETTGTKETVVTGSISGGGGGGYLDRGSGKIESTTISGSIGSYSVDHQQVWIKEGDGSERSFRWKGRDIPLREGQKISIVSVAEEGTLYVVAVVNHTAKTYSLAFSDDKWVLETIGVQKPNGNTALLVGAIVWAACTAVGQFNFGTIGGILGGFFGLVLGIGVGAFAFHAEASDLAARQSKELAAFLEAHCHKVFRDGFPDHAFAQD